MAAKQNMELSHEMLENWKCPICLDVLYKPCVNTCGHVFCFWCMHRAMDPFTPSQCPLCRSQYAHFPQVCEQLHFFLQKAFPKEYSEREKETTEEEETTGVYSLQLHDTERQPNQCEATIIGNPSMCTQWQDQLVQLLPEEMQARAVQCEASTCQDHACCSQHKMPHDKTAKKSAGWQQPRSQRAGSSAGETGSNAAAVLRHRLLHNIRQDFIHHGVGCDSCGLYPIKGRRFKCQNCPDKVGFDLCGSCYDRGLHITGRFNQQHTPEHSMGLVRPQPTMFHIFQAANPELSMAQIQQLTALAFARDDNESAAQPASAQTAGPAADLLEQGTPASTGAAAAAADMVAPASGEAQRRRPSFRQWFSSAPHRPPSAQHATSARPPAASRQRTSSSTEQRSDNHPPSSTHNTEWRWNLGGPSTGGSLGGAYQRPGLAAPTSGADSGSASRLYRVEAVPSSTAGLGSQAADTGADAGQPRQSQALVLPEVPNVWDDMNPAAEEMLPSPADSVEYINGADDNNMANDAMLLIMHAVQARSEGRSLRDDRRSSAEQYWRQMEEDEEAGFFRLSTDGDEAGRQ
ncbi:hypothetical protein WJX79_008557 [Trebouxia sp. C0005]